MTKRAFVFPGQGSQYAGMGKSVAENFTAAAEIFSRADEILHTDFSSLCWNGPDETLNQTFNTQPAIFVTSIAVMEALRQAGYILQPDFVAGHSLGEYVAYVIAGVLSFEDGLKLVRERGRLMGIAGKENPGKMAAILKLTDEQVEAICRQATEEAGWVQIANLNSPGQVIISGSSSGIARAIELAKAAKARRAQELAVSIAAHSKLMESANTHFTEVVVATTLHTPSIPVVGNITAEPLQSVDAIKTEMVGQLTHSVQWTRSIQFMIAQGVTEFIEIGPKDVLSGLIKRIDRTVARRAVEDADGILKLMEAVND